MLKNSVFDKLHIYFFCFGLGLVTTHNWQLWQQDKKLAQKLSQERAPLPALKHTPKISVLVAAWNESDYIEAHINSFLALNYPDIELILCAGGTDDTHQKARLYASEQLIILEQYPGEGKQHALARCYEHATGEIIYFTDADCLFETEALLRLVAPIVNNGEMAATGTIRPLGYQLNRLLPLYKWSADTILSAKTPAYVKGLLGGNSAISRKALEQIGGLSFTATTGTDYQLAKRLLEKGISLYFVKDSNVATEYPDNFQAYRRQQARWLRNLLIYGREYGAKQDVQVTLKTVAIGAAMLVTPFVALLSSKLILTPWALLVLHSTLSKLRYTAFTARLYQRKLTLRQVSSLIPLTLFDFAVWASPTLDLLSSKGRIKW